MQKILKNQGGRHVPVPRQVVGAIDGRKEPALFDGLDHVGFLLLAQPVRFTGAKFRLGA
jgi:hypothetical protein